MGKVSKVKVRSFLITVNEHTFNFHTASVECCCIKRMGRISGLGNTKCKHGIYIVNKSECMLLDSYRPEGGQHWGPKYNQKVCSLYI